MKFSRGKLSAEEREDVALYSVRKEQSLTEMLAPPTPPKGMRSPTKIERVYLDELWAQVNFNRRRVASGIKGKELRDAVRARKAANAEMVEFLDKNDVYDVPLWSVDEVITGSDIGWAAEADIFRYGIDGDSLGMLSKREMNALVARYERETGEWFSEVAKP